MSWRSGLLGIINLLTLAVSAIFLGLGIWMSKSGTKGCGLAAGVGVYMIIASVAVMAVSVAGFIGSCCRVKLLLVFYLVVLLGTIVFGLITAGATLVQGNKGSGVALPGKEYKEYRLRDYPKWIRKLVNDTQNWKVIKPCLVDTKICTIFNNKYIDYTVGKFDKHPLSAIQSGCCKPSNDCGFTYRSPTNWTAENGVYDNPDCKTWDSDPKVLCYNCQSCKAAIADKVNHASKNVAISNFLFFVFLIILFILGCLAYKKDMRDSAYNHP
ncbi:hypothetical protein PTKIN_Ptkin12aG0207700 [Pterospermum kingtungense]